MPITVADHSTIAEHLGYRRPRNQPISETDPDPQQVPPIVHSTRRKSTISSILLSTFTPTTTKKKNITSGSSFMGLGCAASSQVSAPAVNRSSANWEAKKVRKKKQKKRKTRNLDVAMASNNASTSVVVVPDVWCGPGIGLTADAASVDCVVSRRPISGRAKVDCHKVNQRERSSYSARRMLKPEPMSSLDSEYAFGMRRSGLDVFGARYHHHVRHRSPDGREEELDTGKVICSGKTHGGLYFLNFATRPSHSPMSCDLGLQADILMLQNNLLFGGRSDGLDRYRDLRIDVDNMSYEELLELSERIGYVSTGLKEDEIVHCLRKAKHLDNLFSPYPKETEQKCSICQEDYRASEEMGKLECGHLYHIQCIKQWLVRKNICPICKTVVASQQ